MRLLRRYAPRNDIVKIYIAFVLVVHTIYTSTVVLAVESMPFAQFDTFSEAIFLFEVGL